MYTIWEHYNKLCHQYVDDLGHLAESHECSYLHLVKNKLQNTNSHVYHLSYQLVHIKVPCAKILHCLNVSNFVCFLWNKFKTLIYVILKESKESVNLFMLGSQSFNFTRGHCIKYYLGILKQFLVICRTKLKHTCSSKYELCSRNSKIKIFKWVQVVAKLEKY